MFGKLGDIANLMKKAQAMQGEMEKAKQQLEHQSVTGEAGAGMVKVTMNGKYHAVKTEVSPELQNESPEVTEELITAAINDATEKVNALTQQMMSQFGDMFGGMGGGV